MKNIYATSQTISLTEAYAHCKNIATHYENFPVGSLLFPAHLRNHFYAIYAFSRCADDIADEGNVPEEKRLQQLDEWQTMLHEASTTGRSQHPIFIALAETMQQCNLPAYLFEDLLSAFRQDVSVKRYATFTDLLDYCRRSADPVGRLILSLFSKCTEERAICSDAICTALQLANFWQDVVSDYNKGRIYIPQEDLHKFGVSEEDIANKCVTPHLRDLMAFEVERTSTLFCNGEALIPMLTGRLRIEIQWVLNGGNTVLRKIKENDFDVIQKSNNLRKMDVMYNFFAALFTSIVIPLRR